MSLYLVAETWTLVRATTVEAASEDEAAASATFRDAKWVVLHAEPSDLTVSHRDGPITPKEPK